MSNWPQWAFAGMITLSFVTMLYRDGTKGEVSSAVITVLVIGFEVLVLYAGGFWSPWGFMP